MIIFNFKDNISTGGFGPVTENGFGIGYIIRKDWIAVTLSGFKVSLSFEVKSNAKLRTKAQMLTNSPSLF